MRAAALALVIAAVATGPASIAHAEPSDRTLVYTGVALAPADYLLGVTLHEGSHAVAAKLVGARVETFHVFPPGRDPRGHWRFGWTYVTGLRTRADKLWFYLAPKLTDAALLGGFAALVFTGAWPDNRYAEVALTVFGTGLWVDYSKDLLAFRRTNDVVKAFDLWCLRGWRQVPARLVYAATVVGLGVIVARAYQRTFDDDVAAGDAPRIAPLFARSF